MLVSVRPILLSTLLILSGFPTGCDGDVQSIRIAAQDFRFRPNEIRLSASRPIHLIVVNEGRETHEFTSALFSHHGTNVLSIVSADVQSSEGRFTISPGHRLDITLRGSPGTFVFSCAVRGHRGMSGTFFFE